MVVSAQEADVVDVGWAVGVPFVDVVDVAPAGWPVAAGEDAATVAGEEGAALVAVGVAEGAAHAERVAGARHFQRSNHGGGDDEPEDVR